ncbi:MAG: UDP-glucose 4-epimerase GalE [Acidobacteriota bacterium]
MSQDKPAVLIAGGAGYIGSHTAKLLRQNNFTPVILDNLCTGNRYSLRYGPFHEGSIADAALIRQLVEQYSLQGAILFAGHAYVGESTQQPRKYFRNNIIEAIEFLNNILDAGLKRIVFSSSCSIYGIQAKMPISEDSPKDPLSPYAETKLFFEKVLASYASAYGVRYAALRYFNASGDDPDGEIGEHHDPETHLIPLTVYAAMGRAPLKIFGDDYPTPDGTAVRDYIHVTDLADGHLRALNHLIKGGDNLKLNLGTGNGYSVKQVIDAVERISGKKVPAQMGPRREGDAPELVCDPRRAREILGWIPQHSSLDEIVQTAWRWHNELEKEAVQRPPAVY